MNPLLILLLSAAVKRANDASAERRQKEIADALEAYNLDQSRKSTAAIEGMLAKQTPDARKAEMAESVASRAASMADTVKAAGKSDVTALNVKPSADYQASQARAADTVAARTKKAIENLSVMTGGGDAALSSGFRFGRAAGAVDSANRAMGNVTRASYNDINNVRPNPWIDMVAQAGMAYGSSGVLGGKSGSSGTGIDSGRIEDASGNLYDPNKTKRGRWASLWGLK